MSIVQPGDVTIIEEADDLPFIDEEKTQKSVWKLQGKQF